FHRLLQFDSLEGWRKQKGAIREFVFGQFLRESCNLPALIWATPIWFLNTNPLPTGSKVEDAPGKRMAWGNTRRGLRAELRYGNDQVLTIDPRMLAFFSHPELRHRNERRPQLVQLFRD